MAQWIADILLTIPGPTQAWADIIGHLAWPVVVTFLVVRFRRYLRSYLSTLADRLQTDHVKIGAFELTPNSPVWVLDPDEADESTYRFESDDVQRIESIFEFIRTDNGYREVEKWLNENAGRALDIDDFITLPVYASLRMRAFKEIEGLSE